MGGPTHSLAARQSGELTVRVAAAADVHCGEHNRDAVAAAFAAIDETVDVVLVAGDLTTHGEPAQAAVMADACRGLSTPVVAVLGNHDLHMNRGGEVIEALEDGGVRVLERSHLTLETGGSQIGIAGTKGFVGGFRGHGLPDFGEPSLRGIYAEATAEVEALDRGLRAIALCPVRIALLHYAPIADTLRGEPPEIWAFLGSDRLAAPLLEHRPDLVLHGHAHAGSFQGQLEGVPVHNVAVPVMKQDFWIFELTASADQASSAIR